MLLGVGGVRLHPGPRDAGSNEQGLGRSRTDCTALLPARGPRGPGCRAICTGLTDERRPEVSTSTPKWTTEQKRSPDLTLVSQVIKYRNEREETRSSQASTPGSFLPQWGGMGGRGPC